MAEINCKLSQALLRKMDLAHKLAYQLAKSVIQSECAVYTPAPNEYWYNLDDSIVIAEVGLNEAVEYLELLGLLDRHPEHRNLVNVREVAAKRTSEEETATEVAQSAIPEEFINTYISPCSLDGDTKTLVAGNVRGFFGWLRMRGWFPYATGGTVPTPMDLLHEGSQLLTFISEWREFKIHAPSWLRSRVDNFVAERNKA